MEDENGEVTLLLSRAELDYVYIALEFQIDHDNGSAPWHTDGESALAKVGEALGGGTPGKIV